VARPKVYFQVFTVQNSTEELNVSREKREQKIKKAGIRKCVTKKHKFTSSSTWGLVLRRGRKLIAKVKEVDK
jgi:hypothetical protein